MKDRVVRLFPALCAAVCKTHRQYGMEGGSHSSSHALRVGQMALRLLDGRQAVLAAIAGIVHNADRVVQAKHEDDKCWANVDKRETVRLVKRWLRHVPALTTDEIDLIVDAVLKHGGPNDASDTLVLTALRDADRIVNVQLDVVLRSAKQPIPILDLAHLDRDPTATYRDPKSVIYDLSYMSRLWDPNHPDRDDQYCLRLPRAMTIAKAHFRRLREFVRIIIALNRGDGIREFLLAQQ